jgi:hypothetical protein
MWITKNERTTQLGPCSRSHSPSATNPSSWRKSPTGRTYHRPRADVAAKKRRAGALRNAGLPAATGSTAPLHSTPPTRPGPARDERAVDAHELLLCSLGPRQKRQPTDALELLRVGACGRSSAAHTGVASVVTRHDAARPDGPPHRARGARRRRLPRHRRQPGRSDRRGRARRASAPLRGHPVPHPARAPRWDHIRDLGEHRLKDFEHPVQIHELMIEGLPSEFPPLKTLEVPLTLPSPLTSLVGRQRERSGSRNSSEPTGW